jgi:hypothetical protein
MGRVRQNVDVSPLPEHGFHEGAEKCDHHGIRSDKPSHLASGSRTRQELGLEALFMPTMTRPRQTHFARSERFAGACSLILDARAWLINLGNSGRSLIHSHHSFASKDQNHPHRGLRTPALRRRAPPAHTRCRRSCLTARWVAMIVLLFVGIPFAGEGAVGLALRDPSRRTSRSGADVLEEPPTPEATE